MNTTLDKPTIAVIGTEPEPKKSLFDLIMQRFQEQDSPYFRSYDDFLNFAVAEIKENPKEYGTQTERVALVDEIIEWYVEGAEKTPNSQLLYHLTNAILYEDLNGNTDRNKAKNVEYSILSSRQIKERQSSEARVGYDDVAEIVSADGFATTAKNTSKGGHSE